MSLPAIVSTHHPSKVARQDFYHHHSNKPVIVKNNNVSLGGQMAEYNCNTSSSGSSNETPPTLKPSPDSKRKLSNSEIELTQCLASEGVSEPLLKQYTCAWHKDGSLLVQGHMYITANYVCFYSNILGWETKLAIKCREVIQISKQRTILLFPNAISVATLQHEYFFTSFLHRNNAFKVLQCTWRSSMSGITLTRPELINLLQNGKTKKLLTENEEEEDQFSTGGSQEDITRDDHRHESPAGSTETTDDLSSVREYEGRRYSDTETDSCLPSHSLTSTNSCLTDRERREGEEEGREEEEEEGKGRSLKRSLSLVRLDSASDGVIEETDCGSNESKLDKRDTTSWYGQRWIRGLRSSHVINGIIIILITILIFSMLILICKLSQLDPNLRTWLPWQPWCQIICS